MISVAALSAIPAGWWKALGALIAAAVAVVAIGWTVQQIYAAGVTSGQAKSDAAHKATLAQAHADRAAAFERAANAERSLRELDVQTTARIARADALARTAEKTIREAVHADPTFAACERPAAVQRVRDTQHRAIADAAARGADVSRRILQGLPGTGAGPDQPPRRD